jgi:drug/metabolite transporter (DMT)-like permease
VAPRETSPSGAATPAILVVGVAMTAMVIWGATPVATKLGVAEIDPLVIGMLRTLLAALIAAPLALTLRVARPGTRGEFLLITASSLGGFVGFPLLFSMGINMTSAAHGALVLASLPLFTGLFAALAEKRRLALRWWLGCAIAMTGEVLLIGFRFGFEDAGASVGGDLIIFASCAAASLGYVAGGRLSRSIGAWPTTLWGITGGGLVLAPVLPFVVSRVAWGSVGATGFLAVGYLVLFSSILAYAAWYWALSRGDMARVGALQFTQPIVGIALAALVLSEPITPPLALAAAGILLGVWIVQRK